MSNPESSTILDTDYLWFIHEQLAAGNVDTNPVDAVDWRQAARQHLKDQDTAWPQAELEAVGPAEELPRGQA